jgi:hypothetical protein
MAIVGGVDAEGARRRVPRDVTVGHAAVLHVRGVLEEAPHGKGVVHLRDCFGRGVVRQANGAREHPGRDAQFLCEVGNYLSKDVAAVADLGGFYAEVSKMSSVLFSKMRKLG